MAQEEKQKIEIKHFNSPKSETEKNKQKDADWIHLDSPEEEEEEAGPALPSPQHAAFDFSEGSLEQRQLAYINGKHEVI